MILHAVQIHTDSSQSCHSPRKNPNNQFIKHIYLGVEEQPANRPGHGGWRGLEYSSKERHGRLVLDRLTPLVSWKPAPLSIAYPLHTLCFVQQDLNFKTLRDYTLNEQPRTYCIAQGTLLNVMWQPGWVGSLGANGYIYCCFLVTKLYLTLLWLHGL